MPRHHHQGRKAHASSTHGHDARQGRRPWGALLTALLLGSSGAQGSGAAPMSTPQAVTRSLFFYRQGRFHKALEVATAAIERDPLQRDLHAAAGLYCERLGDHGCAVSHFELAEGSSLYESLAIGAHATALAAAGCSRRAAALREDTRIAAGDDHEEFLVVLRSADDCFQNGDLACAEEHTWEALSIHPRSSMALATLARVAYAMGDTDSGDANLWLARTVSEGALAARVHLVESEVYLALGDPASAGRELDAARAHNRGNIATVAAQIALFTRTGCRHEAELLLNDAVQHFGHYGERPDMAVSRARLALARGDTDEARSICGYARAVTPYNSAISRLAADLHAAGLDCR